MAAFVFLLFNINAYPQDNNTADLKLSAEDVINNAFATFKQNEEFVTKIINFKERKIEDDFAIEEFFNSPDPQPRSHNESTSDVRARQNDIIVSGVRINVPHIFSTLYEYNFPADQKDQTRNYNGVECVVIEFKPKTRLRISSLADHFTHRLSGQIFINKNDMNIIGITTAASKPFSFTYWKVIFPIRIKIEFFTLQFSQKYVLGVAMRDSAEATSKYRVYGNVHSGVRKYTFEYYDHKLKKEQFRP